MKVRSEGMGLIEHLSTFFDILALPNVKARKIISQHVARPTKLHFIWRSERGSKPLRTMLHSLQVSQSQMPWLCSMKN